MCAGPEPEKEPGRPGPHCPSEDSRSGAPGLGTQAAKSGETPAWKRVHAPLDGAARGEPPGCGASGWLCTRGPCTGLVGALGPFP